MEFTANSSPTAPTIFVSSCCASYFASASGRNLFDRLSERRLTTEGALHCAQFCAHHQSLLIATTSRNVGPKPFRRSQL